MENLTIEEKDNEINKLAAALCGRSNYLRRFGSHAGLENEMSNYANKIQELGGKIIFRDTGGSFKIKMVEVTNLSNQVTTERSRLSEMVFNGLMKNST